MGFSLDFLNSWDKLFLLFSIFLYLIPNGQKKATNFRNCPFSLPGVNNTLAKCRGEVLQKNIQTVFLPSESTLPELQPISVPMEQQKISWMFGMTPVDLCVTPGTPPVPRLSGTAPRLYSQTFLVCPGTNVSFQWAGTGHNVVIGLTRTEYESCSGLRDNSGSSGPWTWVAEDPTNTHEDTTVNNTITNTTVSNTITNTTAVTTTKTHYFACGVNPPFHCDQGGMKAIVRVQQSCPEE